MCAIWFFNQKDNFREFAQKSHVSLSKRTSRHVCSCVTIKFQPLMQIYVGFQNFLLQTCPQVDSLRSRRDRSRAQRFGLVEEKKPRGFAAKTTRANTIPPATQATKSTSSIALCFASKASFTEVPRSLTERATKSTNRVVEW